MRKGIIVIRSLSRYKVMSINHDDPPSPPELFQLFRCESVQKEPLSRQARFPQSCSGTDRVIYNFELHKWAIALRVKDREKKKK